MKMAYQLVSEFESILTEFEDNLGDPEGYLKCASSSIGLTLIKRLYESCCGITRSNGETFGPLDTLAIDGLDEESVWQQLVLHNTPLVGHLDKCCRKLTEQKQAMQLQRQQHTNDCDDGTDDVTNDEIYETAEVSAGNNSIETDSNDSNDRLSDVDEAETVSSAKRQKTKASSQVDDRFFRLSDMEEFLRLEDKREEESRDRTKGENEDDEIDLFADIDSPTESGENDSDVEWDAVVEASSNVIGKAATSKTKPHKATRHLKYNDFFDPPVNDVMPDDVTHDNDESEEDSDHRGDENEGTTESDDEVHTVGRTEDSDGSENESAAILSTHEQRQLKLRQQITQLEKKNVAQKPWQLKGEITAGDRNENSLLEEDLLFDQTTRPPPAFTEETTATLEDIIRRRVSDQAWDDVERKEKPIEQPYEYRKRPTLDQDKSKLSLSEVYEKEFVKQSEGKRDEEERAEYVEIRKLATKLFTRLDALSNFCFTPKPPKDDIKIITNAPAITIEEIIPAAVTDASLLAPEEIHSKPKANPIGKKERTDTERKRERRLKKQRHRSKAHERERHQKLVAKLKPGLGNKYSQQKAIRELERASKKTDKITLIDGRDRKEKSGLRSSSAFFERLQEQVSVEARDMVGERKGRRKAGEERVTSTKLKL